MREVSPELRALSDLARAAAEGAYEVEGLLRRICSMVVDTFDFDRCAISRYEPETGTLVPLAAHGVPLEELPAQLAVEDQPIVQRALERREAVLVPDVREDPVVSPELVEQLGIRTALAVPLAAHGRCLGFLGADRGGEVFHLEQETLDLLTTIGAVAGVFLQRALEEGDLRRTNELAGNFIALASHELRTPAAVVHGIAATLHLRGDRLSGDQLHQLRRTLYVQSDRLRRLVDQLLDLSRLESSAIHIEPRRFAVRRRIEELVLMVAGERAADLEIDVRPDLETVADPDAFDRVASNLITNAFRYGSPPVRIEARQSDRHFRLAVEDRGDGVAAEFVPRLFERFTRSEDSRSTTSEGSGLGLSIAQSYAHALGGELLYEQAVPHGARFELVLPAPPPSSAPPAG